MSSIVEFFSIVWTQKVKFYNPFLDIVTFSISRPSGVVIRKAGCFTKGSRVRIPGKAWMSNCPSLAPPVAVLKNQQTGGARFIPRSRLSTYPFRVFSGFLRNSCKYELGSFRKTPRKTFHPQAQVTRETIVLKTNNQQPTIFSAKMYYCLWKISWKVIYRFQYRHIFNKNETTSMGNFVKMPSFV